MKAYLIKKLTFFAPPCPIDTFHYTMFHGIAEREGDGLRLNINAFRTVQVFQPRLNFVVSEEVARLIRSIATVQLLRVALGKAISFPYEAGDFSHWDIPGYDDDGDGPEQFFEKQPSRSDLVSGLPEYFELICPSYDDVVEQFDASTEVVAFMGPVERDDAAILKLSSEMLEKFPVLQMGSCTIFHESVFERLVAYFDWTYFLQTAFEIV